MNIIKFDDQSALPAYLQQEGLSNDINKEVVRAAAFPTMSIKGKKFTISKDGIKKVLTKPSDPDEVAQSVGVVILRANMNAKVFYIKKYAEGDSDGAQPDCYSMDGAAPSERARNPQAKKCAVCPHNVWGSRTGDGDRDGEKKGKACNDGARLAIAAPDALEPMLLRVPPASLKPLRDALKIIDQRKIPYNAVVMKVGFDIEAASPKLTFKPVGLVPDESYGEIRNELYDGELVRGIVGLDDQGHGQDDAPESTDTQVSGDELDAALAQRTVAKAAAAAKTETKAEAKPKAAAKPAPAPAPAPVSSDELDDIMGGAAPAPAPAPAPRAAKAETRPAAESSSLVDELDALLNSSDD